MSDFECRDACGIWHRQRWMHLHVEVLLLSLLSDCNDWCLHTSDTLCISSWLHRFAIIFLDYWQALNIVYLICTQAVPFWSRFLNCSMNSYYDPKETSYCIPSTSVIIECRWTVHVVSQPFWDHSSLCVAVTETNKTMAVVTDAVQDVGKKGKFYAFQQS